MARKKIREYDSKRLLRAHLLRLAGIQLDLKAVQVTKDTDWALLAKENPWLADMKLVVKPDALFGKRGKSGLVGLNLSLPDAQTFIAERMGKDADVEGTRGPVHHFIVEPFVPHEKELYLSIVSDRLGAKVSFSDAGGVEVEENWERMRSVVVPTDAPLTPDLLAPLVAPLPLEARSKVETFIRAAFAVYQDLDFTLLEMNPLALVDNEPYPLDMRGEVDDTAAFKQSKNWGDDLEFPQPFGRVMSPSEEQARAVHALDEKTGASLKLTILNPRGRIWTMVAGGGASVIYSDTVGDLGMASELGNYAEYSGAPNQEETLKFARVLLDCATAPPHDGRNRALVVGGGIANFTDVSQTFRGIIQAMREKQEQLKAAKMRIYVRRGGPNYEAGLKLMKQLGEEIVVPFEVHGPEASMTGICKAAIDWIKQTP
eukprot:jgi/Chlat1/1574/Chrsp123S01832